MRSAWEVLVRFRGDSGDLASSELALNLADKLFYIIMPYIWYGVRV